MLVKLIHSFLYKLTEVGVILYGFRKLYILDKGCSYATLHSIGKFISIVKAFTKGLHLVCASCKTHNVVSPIASEIEYKFVLLLVVSTKLNHAAKITLLFGYLCTTRVLFTSRGLEGLHGAYALCLYVPAGMLHTG